MVFQTLRSGWLIAALAVLFPVSILSQTDPRMIVAWDPIVDPECCSKYIIETTVGSLPFIKAADCPTDTAISGCTVSGIDGVVTYKIRVAGVDKSGVVGEFSDGSLTFLFASIQPLSPAFLSQVAATSTTPGKIAKKLSWPAVTKFRTGPLFPVGAVIEYRIYQAGTGPAVVIATSSTNSFTVQDLSKHKSYQFYVTAVVNGIESYTSPSVRINN